MRWAGQRRFVRGKGYNMKKLIALVLAVAMMTTAVPQNTNQVYAATSKEASAESKKVTLSDSKIKLKIGETYQLTAKGIKGSVKWKSNNKSAVTVSQKGLVKAKNPGKATITLTGDKIGTVKCVVQVKITQKQAQKRITALQKKYPEGLSWTNENNEYYWSAINCSCYGCIAFAGEVSDKVFGKNAKVTTHKDFDKIKVGDHIRIGGYHSVIVWKKTKDSVIVVEGNYSSSVHWGREITRRELKAEGFYVDSRY